MRKPGHFYYRNQIRQGIRPERSTQPLYSLLLTLYYLSLDYFSALDAASAHLHALGAAARGGRCLNRLKIRVPAPTGYVVRVRNVVSELRSLAAKLTYLCHDIAPKNQTCDANFQKTPRASLTLVRSRDPYVCGVSGRHERIRTADLYRVKVAL
jgi:hypothetical protein